MVALAAGRNTPARYDGVERHPVKGGVTIYPGALVVLDAAGWAMPGQAGVGLKAVGRGDNSVPLTAVVNGDVNVRVRRGRFQFVNSASTEAITRADIGNPAYIVDDQTVAKTNGSSTRSVAGTIRDVDAQGVWIEI